MDAETKDIFGGQSAEDRNSKFMERNKDSLKHVATGETLSHRSQIVFMHYSILNCIALLYLINCSLFLSGIRMLNILSPSQVEKSLARLTKLESFSRGVDLEVTQIQDIETSHSDIKMLFFFQTCMGVYTSLVDGDLGPAGSGVTAPAFRESCAGRFPQAEKCMAQKKDGSAEP